MSRPSRLALSTLAVLLIAAESHAACMNKFVRRTEGPRQIVTFLTGKVTFQEAQVLANAINRHEAPVLEWVDEKGKMIAKQHGELKVLRPMPVGCDGKKSGVVLTATFAILRQPAKKMSVKLADDLIVDFDEQTQ